MITSTFGDPKTVPQQSRSKLHKLRKAMGSGEQNQVALTSLCNKVISLPLVYELVLEVYLEVRGQLPMSFLGAVHLAFDKSLPRPGASWVC